MSVETDLAKANKRIADLELRMNRAVQGNGTIVNNGNRVVADISVALSELAKKNHTHNEFSVVSGGSGSSKAGGGNSTPAEDLRSYVLMCAEM
jgi:hypothetical protein